MSTNDFERAQHLSQLWQTIRLAGLRCLRIAEIAERLGRIWEYPHSNQLLGVLRQRELQREDAELLYQTVRALAKKAESLPPRDRDAAHRAIRRVVQVLPTDIASSIAKDFLEYPLKAGREIVYRGLLAAGVSPELAPHLIRRFRETGDEQFLELIARNPSAVLAADPEFLVNSLSEPYWRARVFETLLAAKRDLAYSLAPRFPREFAHAVGRLEDPDAAELLEDLLASNKDNTDYLSLYAYALGRLGRRDELQRLSSHVEAHWGGRPHEELAV